MRPGYRLQALGLVLAGFILGIIVSGLNTSPDLATRSSESHGSVAAGDYANASHLESLARTPAWDVLMDSGSDGRRIVLGQQGQIRVVIQDDHSAMYVFTYKPGDTIWQGRLMDVGNDGTIEVADLSSGHCEAFD